MATRLAAAMGALLLVQALACQGDGTGTIDPTANDAWFTCEPDEPCECTSDDDCDGASCVGGVCAATCGDGVCSAGEDCSADCATSTCGDGLCAPGEICFIDCASTNLCGDGVCGLGEACPADCQVACPTIPVGITPQNVGILGPNGVVNEVCLPADPFVVGVFQDINTFWGSAITPCICHHEFCYMNALANKYVPYLGYVYYDPNVILALQNAGQGSLLGPAWLMAHEVGHNMQAVFGYDQPTMLGDELWADCVSGYFIAWLQCSGRLGQGELQTLQTAICAFEETKWLDPNTHGPCSARVQYTARGMDGYRAGLLPSQVCPYVGL